MNKLFVSMLIVMCGCGRVVPTDSPKASPSPTPQTTAVVIEKTHWVRVDDIGGCEEYDKCIRDSDGLLLIEVMHAQQSTGSFGVYEKGALLGEYMTRKQAKAAAATRNRSCAESNP